MRLPKLHAACVLAAAIAVVLAVAALAGATNVKRFDSKVTLARANPFHGHVSSPRHACEQSRRVKVFKKRPGHDRLFGKTTSNNDGRWAIPAAPNGRFYAKVTRRSEGTAGTIIVCRADRSRTRHFSP
jgi:hypothetical protein